MNKGMEARMHMLPYEIIRKNYPIREKVSWRE